METIREMTGNRLFKERQALLKKREKFTLSYYDTDKAEVNRDVALETLAEIRHLDRVIDSLESYFSDLVEIWHSSDQDPSSTLAEYLGLNQTEYAAFVKDEVL